MQKGLNLVELAQRIHANVELKRDYIADTRQTQLVVVPAQANEAPRVALTLPDPAGAEVTLPLLPLAHRQLGGRVGIHATYYDRMLAQSPQLLATNVNHWFAAAPERRMVRTINGDARAFLSDRYQRIDHEEVAEVALPILAGLPDVQIISCELTEQRMYIQAVTPRVQGEVAKGDVVQAGVIISNSEVGSGAVRVSPLVYRLRCLNGMVAADGMRAFHVGRQVDDTQALWADDTRRADDRAVLLKVRDMVAAAVDEARFAQRVAKMSTLTGITIAGTAVQAVEVLTRKIGATKAEQGSILESLIRGGDLTAWGVLNAVTAQAHSTPSYDRAVEFEQIGGQLLEAGPGFWREVVAA